MKEKKPINIQIGSRIKLAREEAGYTQEYFAEKIDVSVQYVSDLERGVVGTSIPTLIRICQVLQVSSDYLLFNRSGGADLNRVEYRLNNLTPEQLIIMNKGVQVLLDALHCGSKEHSLPD